VRPVKTGRSREDARPMELVRKIAGQLVRFPDIKLGRMIDAECKA
jgi:hypothetical protein